MKTKNLMIWASFCIRKPLPSLSKRKGLTNLLELLAEKNQCSNLKVQSVDCDERNYWRRTGSLLLGYWQHTSSPKGAA